MRSRMPTQAPTAAGFQTAATRRPAEISTATPGRSKGRDQEAGAGIEQFDADLASAPHVVHHPIIAVPPARQIRSAWAG